MTRLARKTSFQFPTLRSEGNLLPDDLLQRVAAQDPRVPGLSPDAYHLLPGETLREAISRAWLRLQGVWTSFQAALARLPPDDRATTLTRDRWLLPLFQELGYGRLVAARPLEVGERSFPVSHAYQHSPIHLLGWRVDLDRRTEKVAGAAQSAPHSLVQDLLNRSDDHLWALLSNGRTLRLLRDNISLVRQAYLEFDLEAMMAGEHFADFALLWLVCHQSRVEAAKPGDCWLEKWFLHARDEGIRALHRLRGGVQKTIELLGSGFLKHRANASLRESLQSGALDVQDFYRELLRLAYRLILLFVAEDRGLLLDPAAPEAAHDRYTRYYSTARLRRLAERRRGGPHGDLWQGLRLVLAKLYAGCPELGLPALGSFLWSSRATPHLDRAELANEDLLAALHALARVDDERGVSYAVSWQSLAADELGSVYEALLELHPRLHTDTGLFELATAAGNERKTSGSYYTPEELVERLLDSALTPVLDAATRGKPRDAAIAALLDLKVCDPACGSGHFLVAAARRIARRLASLRTGDDEPAPSAMQAALRDVVGRCLFGVDINPMAVELCKVSLWMEALEPGRPLSFLESHIQCGNALLGATPALLARGIPEDAFAAVLEGDDREAAKTLRKRDRDERKGARTTLDLFAAQSPAAAPTSADASLLRTRAQQVDRAADGSLPAVEAKESDFTTWQESPEQRRAEFLADLWCASLVWPKTPELIDAAPTTSEWLHLLRKPDDAKPATLQTLADAKKQYKFFRWHLRFPQVFAPATENTAPDDPCGWTGGFDVMLGNPPWERIKLQEKEFFAQIDPSIAQAETVAGRRALIQNLKNSNPTGFRLYEEAKRKSEGEGQLLSGSGRYPLCGHGDVNTYAVFAELMRHLLGRLGYMGCIVPSGIATDDTSKQFFCSAVQKDALVSVFDFENSRPLFPSVHRSYKFCILVLRGPGRIDSKPAKFAFFLRDVTELSDPSRQFHLSTEEILLINPNTGTCPVFRSSRDANIIKAIYRINPVLIRNTVPESNPWGIKLTRMFDMTNDFPLFRQRKVLSEEGWTLSGNVFEKGDQVYLPLYEGKFGHQFNHRFARFAGESVEEFGPEDLRDPLRLVEPQFWVPAHEVYSFLSNKSALCRSAFLAFRRVARDTDERTCIATIAPWGASSYGWILVLGPSADQLLVLLGIFNSFTFDYLLRNSLSQPSIPQGTFAQLACPAPEKLSHHASFIRERVMELVYTAWDLSAFASEGGHDHPPFVWDENRRHLLRCELDAAVFLLYALARENVEHILDQFPIVRRKDEKAHGEYRTKRAILERYDAMADAIATGRPYQTVLDPPPAHPSLTHPPRPPGAPVWPLPPAPREIFVDFAATSEEVTPPTTPAKPGKSRKQRSTAARVEKPASAPTDDFQLTSPPHAPQLGLAFATAAPDRAPPPPPEFQLTAPAPQLGLGFSAPPPPVAPSTPEPSPASAPADDDPPRIRALRDAGGKLARPEVVAVVRALHRATEPLSKDQLLAASGVDEKAWPALIKFLLEADLVAAQGKARGTRYTLT